METKRRAWRWWWEEGRGANNEAFVQGRSGGDEDSQCRPEEGGGKSGRRGGGEAGKRGGGIETEKYYQWNASWMYCKANQKKWMTYVVKMILDVSTSQGLTRHHRFSLLFMCSSWKARISLPSLWTEVVSLLLSLQFMLASVHTALVAVLTLSVHAQWGLH